MKLRPWTLPENYAGATWYGYLIAPVTRHRDSEILDESNWAHQIKVLFKVDETQEAEEWGRDGGQPWEIVTENHWAVGWFEWVAVHSEAKPWIAALERLADRLDQYPIADEVDYSIREHESAAETWANADVKSRVRWLQRARFKGSVLVARRDEMPSDDTGSLQEILNEH